MDLSNVVIETPVPHRGTKEELEDFVRGLPIVITGRNIKQLRVQKGAAGRVFIEPVSGQITSTRVEGEVTDILLEKGKPYGFCYKGVGVSIDYARYSRKGMPY